MDIALKIIGLLGGVLTVKGLVGVLTGANDIYSGRKNENPQKLDNGLESVIWGGAMAAVAGTITAVIIAQMSGISF